MKNGILILMIIALFMVGWGFAAQSWTSSTSGQYREARVQVEKYTFTNTWPHTNMDNLSATTRIIRGIVTRIVYDSTGTDTDWDLEIQDEIGIVLAGKDALTSGSEPGHFMIYPPDSDVNGSPGIPISGYLTIDIDGVAQAAEVQTITSAVNADYGTYTITIDGEETAALDFAATTAEIMAAIETLSHITDPDPHVTSVLGTLNLGTADVVVTFDAGLGNVPAISLTGDIADTNAGAITYVETTEGGNAFTNLDIYIFYEQ